MSKTSDLQVRLRKEDEGANPSAVTKYTMEQSTMTSEVTKFYPIDLLNDLRYEGEVIEGDIHLEKIQEEFYDQDRWSTYIRYTFKDVNTGKYYQITYEQGSTEYQDDGGFYALNSADGTKAECFEVKPVEVTVIKYEPVLED